VPGEGKTAFAEAAAQQDGGRESILYPLPFLALQSALRTAQFYSEPTAITRAQLHQIAPNCTKLHQIAPN
jgi:hypothetical protein